MRQAQAELALSPRFYGLCDEQFGLALAIRAGFQRQGDARCLTGAADAFYTLQQFGDLLHHGDCAQRAFGRVDVG